MGASTSASEIVYWDTSDVDRQKVQEILRDITSRFNMEIFEDRHDIEEFQEYFQLRQSNPSIVEEEGRFLYNLKDENVELSKKIRRISEEITTLESEVQNQEDLLFDVLDCGWNQVVSNNAEELSEGVQISQRQLQTVTELDDLIQERKELVERKRDIASDLGRLEDISHETYEQALAQNADLIVKAVETGYIILNTRYILSEMDSSNEASETIEETKMSEGSLGKAKKFLSKSSNTGEIETESGNEAADNIKETLTEIYDKYRDQEDEGKTADPDK